MSKLTDYRDALTDVDNEVSSFMPDDLRYALETLQAKLERLDPAELRLAQLQGVITQLANVGSAVEELWADFAEDLDEAEAADA
jgi:hypothetical protein